MARQKYRRSNFGSTLTREGRTFFCAVRTLAVTLIASCVLVLASGGIVCSLSDPISAVDIAAWISLGIASFIGGAAAFFSNREDAQRTALLSGVMFICVLVTLSFICDCVRSPFWMLVGYAASVLLCLLGSHAARRIFGSRRRGRRRY
ncbi:MAG: hypothetical protein IJE84_04965 [Clostridia bacterium]|nr:hypothetical protein [Clostridia bacterium]